MNPTGPGPLAGVRVVEVAGGLAAYCGRLFAGLGADVVLVEPPGGSPERRRRPHLTMPSGEQVSYRFLFHSLGKSCTVADLHSPAGRAALDAMLGPADVLVTSGGPAVLAELGLVPPAVQRRHPHLVHVAVSPFGLTGPLADAPASDLTLLAAGGLLGLAGEPDREPIRPYGEQSAVIASLHGTVAALLALLRRERNGRGAVVDVSVQEAVAHSIENAVQYYDLEGIVRQRNGAGPSEAGTGLFRCADGHVYLVCSIGGRFLGWEQLVDWVESHDPVAGRSLREERWRDAAYRRTGEAYGEFEAIVESFFRTRLANELYESGQDAGVNICPVSTAASVLANRQLVERRFFRAVRGMDGLIAPGPPYSFDRAGTADDQAMGRLPQWCTDAAPDAVLAPERV
jgi:benzylsuccinate CoA-transferase BbsE subunit